MGAVVVGLQRRKEGRNRDGWLVLAVVVWKREREREREREGERERDWYVPNFIQRELER